MTENRVGIIGGSGLYDIEGMEIKSKEEIYTPFGRPSDKIIIGDLNGREIVFLPRHGREHKILPSEVNYRANIWIMKKLGVQRILSVSAVGSLKQEIRPLDIVLVDQFVDRTFSRKNTFFGNGLAAHVEFSNPICQDLRKIVYKAAPQEAGEGRKIHWGGVYCNIEGPAFSTRAESLLYKSWGLDIIGMTNATEAKLAREAEICYVTMAMVTDYDCWNEENEQVNVEIILENLKKNVETAKRIIKRAILEIPEKRTCGCEFALKTAFITQPDQVPEEIKIKLKPLIGKYYK